MKIFFLFAVSFLSIEAKNYQMCSSLDSDCIKRSSQSAIPYFTSALPELDIGSIDPLKLQEISLHTAGLNLILTDVLIKGFKKVVINDIRFDIVNDVVTIDFKSDFKLKSKYVCSGRVAVLPVTGDGDALIVIRGLHIKASVTLKKIDRDGKRYIKIGQSKYTFDVGDKAQFSFENLFGGNKALAEPVLTFINTNWKLMVETFGYDIINPIFAAAVDHLRLIFNKIPIDDIVTDFKNYY